MRAPKSIFSHSFIRIRPGAAGTRVFYLPLSMFLLHGRPSSRLASSGENGPSYLSDDISFESAELPRLFVLRHTLTRPRGFFIPFPAFPLAWPRPFHLHCVGKAEDEEKPTTNRTRSLCSVQMRLNSAPNKRYRLSRRLARFARLIAWSFCLPRCLIDGNEDREKKGESWIEVAFGMVIKCSRIDYY